MKRQNQFELLSSEDRQFIIDLCEKHTYAEAAKILAEPRPVGLSLSTGSSNLCRFYTRTQRDALTTGTIGQYSRAIQMRHQAEGTGHTEALLALIQNRLLEALRNGKALADLTTEFRLFFHTHRAYIAETKWRDTRSDDDLNRSWDDYVEFVGTQPTCDFRRTDVDDPVGNSAHITHFNDTVIEDLDMSIERVHKNPEDLKPAEKVKDELLALLGALFSQPPKGSATTPTSGDLTHPPAPKESAPISQNSIKFPDKFPAISPIPPISAFSKIAAGFTSTTQLRTAHG